MGEFYFFVWLEKIGENSQPLGHGVKSDLGLLILKCVGVFPHHRLRGKAPDLRQIGLLLKGVESNSCKQPNTC